MSGAEVKSPEKGLVSLPQLVCILWPFEPREFQENMLLFKSELWILGNLYKQWLSSGIFWCFWFGRRRVGGNGSSRHPRESGFLCYGSTEVTRWPDVHGFTPVYGCAAVDSALNIPTTAQSFFGINCNQEEKPGTNLTREWLEFWQLYLNSQGPSAC